MTFSVQVGSAMMKEKNSHTRLRSEEPTHVFLHVAVNHFTLRLPVGVHYTYYRYPARPRLIQLVSAPCAVQGLDERAASSQPNIAEPVD